MTHPAPSPQQERLDAIRNRAALASPRWGVLAGAEFQLTAGEDGREVVATIAKETSVDDRELLVHAAADLRWLLAAYDRLVDRYRQVAGRTLARPVRQDVARACALACRWTSFRIYLKERHGLEEPLDDTRVATKVRSLLAVKSRAELDTDPAAAERWFSLKADYEMWRQQ